MHAVAEQPVIGSLSSALDGAPVRLTAAHSQANKRLMLAPPDDPPYSERPPTAQGRRATGLPDADVFHQWATAPGQSTPSDAVSARQGAAVEGVRPEARERTGSDVALLWGHRPRIRSTISTPAGAPMSETRCRPKEREFAETAATRGAPSRSANDRHAVPGGLLNLLAYIVCGIIGCLSAKLALDAIVR